MSTDAATVLSLTASRPATLGPGRLICVDGPAGSGKTTLAAAVAAATGAQVVHVDDLLEGWRGLPRVGARLHAMLRPLAAGQPSSYEHYDWEQGRFTGTVPVPVAPLLVVEGVGSGQASYAPLVTALVWVEAPADLRLERGLLRDGPAMQPYWRQWQLDEEELFARQGARGRADLIVDGTGRLPPRSP